MDIDFHTYGWWSLIQEWALVHVPQLLIIIVIAFVAQRFAGRFIDKTVRRVVKQGAHSKEAEEKREGTLIQIINGLTLIFIWVTASLMILAEIGIAVGPILAAAGIAGIAIGFGGQYLIRDLISGAFIIIENQFRTGDVVCFDTTCGLVENMSIRMTTLRDLDGTVHHVPHGEVKKVSNLSKFYSRVNLDVGIAYDTDLEQAIAVVNRVGQELAEDKEWKNAIISPPQFLRVDAFGDSAVIIKILGDTKPIKQWDVTGELRKRLKIAFDKEGIVIPFPQRTLHMAGSEAPLR